MGKLAKHDRHCPFPLIAGSVPVWEAYKVRLAAVSEYLGVDCAPNIRIQRWDGQLSLLQLAHEPTRSAVVVKTKFFIV